jgi:hypothetical protein
MPEKGCMQLMAHLRDIRMRQFVPPCTVVGFDLTTHELQSLRDPISRPMSSNLYSA